MVEDIASGYPNVKTLMSASRKFSIAEIYTAQTRREVLYADADTVSRLTKVAVSILMSVKQKLFVH